MFSLFSPSTASAYANSFQQARPISGFENILEDRFAKMLAEVPLERYKQEMAFARDALGEKAEMEGAKMQYDYYKERDADAARRDRINAVLKMAQAGGGFTASQLTLPSKRDAMSQLLGFTQVGDSLASSMGRRMAGSKAGLTAALEGFPKEPSFETSLEPVDAASTIQATQFTTPVAPPAKLQDVTATPANINLADQFLKYLKG